MKYFRCGFYLENLKWIIEAETNDEAAKKFSEIIKRDGLVSKSGTKEIAVIEAEASKGDNVVRKVRIIELDEFHPARLDGVRYNAQLLTSVDYGKHFYYCGNGKWCKTKEEAEEYKKYIEEEEMVCVD